MKKILILTFIVTLAFAASVFICNTAYAQSVSPWNVEFEVKYGEYAVSYSLEREISEITDQAQRRGFYLGCRGKLQLYEELLSLGLDKAASREYILPNFGETVKKFSFAERERKDAFVEFDRNGFIYTEGIDGAAIDEEKLFLTAINSCGTKISVDLPIVIDKAVTVSDLKKNTALKSSFTTTYYNSGANRCYNISLAAKSLDGTVVGVGETFSFNNTVGARTEKNGYKTSKIIMDGNYADGVGGGVCQVSTTLYNALLLAGFIPKASQHTLISSYVKAGFDAMVSYGVADLTFVNDTAYPIYISAKTDGKTITFKVYGEPNVYRIERETVETREPYETVEVIDKIKYPELVFTDQVKVITNGSDGVKSKSYLNYYLGDTLIEKRLIRVNSYKKVNKVLARGYEERAESEQEQNSAPL